MCRRLSGSEQLNCDLFLKIAVVVRDSVPTIHLHTAHPVYQVEGFCIAVIFRLCGAEPTTSHKKKIALFPNCGIGHGKIYSDAQYNYED